MKKTTRSYFVGARFDKQLFNKLNKHPMSNSNILRKGVQYYFRSQEPNQKIDDYVNDKTEDVKKSFNNEYDYSLVELLKEQVTDLKNDKQYLQAQVNALMVVRMPLLQRVIHKLKQGE